MISPAQFKTSWNIKMLYIKATCTAHHKIVSIVILLKSHRTSTFLQAQDPLSEHPNNEDPAAWA
jgi:hypothetical protein